MHTFKNGRFFSWGTAGVRDTVNNTREDQSHRTRPSGAEYQRRTRTEGPPPNTGPITSAPGSTQSRRQPLRLPARTPPPTRALTQPLSLQKAAGHPATATHKPPSQPPLSLESQHTRPSTSAANEKQPQCFKYASTHASPYLDHDAAVYSEAPAAKTLNIKAETAASAVQPLPETGP